MKSAIQTLLDSKPLLLWPLDEIGTPWFHDLSGYRDHADMAASPVVGAGGPGGRPATSMNGTSQYANRDPGVGACNAPLPAGAADPARTMEIWVYPTGTGVFCALGYGVDATVNQCMLMCDTSAANCFTDGINVGNNRSWASAPALNVWTHIAFTYAGGANGAAIFYKNGVANLTTTLTLNTAGPVANLSIRAGRRPGTGTGYFAGRLALAAIYDAALTPGQVREHFLAGQADFLPRATAIHRLRGT